MEEKKEKKKNIFLFFLKMIGLYIIFDLLSTIIGALLPSSIMYNKYGYEFISEIILAFFVVIAMLLAKNSYVFTEKRIGFFKSLLIGATELILSILIFTSSAFSLQSFSFFNFINLTLYCFAIGIAEEFLCRGWIQNEFIEKFGKSRKQIILSIILSSLIFGLIHITNALYGQTLFETFIQIIQATAGGVFLGSVYYRTKNIWAVAFLHGFYDLAVFLPELTLYKSCTYGTPTANITVFSIVSSVIISAIYILSSIILLRKSKVNELLDENYQITEEEKKKDKKQKLILIPIIIGIGLISEFMPLSDNFIKEYEEYETCYEFETKTINYNNGFTTTFPQIDSKKIIYQKEMITQTTNELNEIVSNVSTENYEFEIYFNEDVMLVIENKKTNEIVELDDGLANNFILKENELDYELIIHSSDMMESFVYYAKINKSDISNSKEFLENVKNSLIKLDSPLLVQIGFIALENTNDTYPLLVTDLDEYFIIDKDNKVKLLEFDFSE